MSRIALTGAVLAFAVSTTAAGGPGLNGRARTATHRTVMTEHPSSLVLMKKRFGQLRSQIQGPRLWPTVIEMSRTALMTADRQVREFVYHSIRRTNARTKLIDFEGKPIDPAVIPTYVEKIEGAGMVAGWGRDRALYIRLPGRTETSVADRARRTAIFEISARENLVRAAAGKPLPLDRFIVAETFGIEDLWDVHADYDDAAERAVDAAIASGTLDANRRSELLESIRRVQAVPLFETAGACEHAATIVESYHHGYAQRYGTPLPALLVWVAGSDLAREVGPVAAHLLRTVMSSRLVELEERLGIHIVRWVGSGSGAMRAGPGKTPSIYARLHPGMSQTVQPDMLDQRHLGDLLTAIENSADADVPRLSAEQARAYLALGTRFAAVHAELSSNYALATVRLANLIQPINQRGRLSEAKTPLLYVEGDNLFLRSAVPGNGDSGYGRVLDLSSYAQILGAEHGEERALLEEAQRHVLAHWPRGLSDPRAISGAFARYVSGYSLTTVAGLGTALAATAGRPGAGELRWLAEYLVQNDGFVLTRDRALVEQRLRVLRPDLSDHGRDTAIADHFSDLSRLETYLGRPIEAFINVEHRERYEADSWALYRNQDFIRYMRGQDLEIERWVDVVSLVLRLLDNDGWNRTG